MTPPSSAAADRAKKTLITEMWRLVVDEQSYSDDLPAWVRHNGGTRSEEAPTDPLAAALHRLLRAGIDPEDLTDVVRALQVEVLYNVCQLLDDPTLIDVAVPARRGSPLRWEITAVRDTDPEQRVPVLGLHEEFEDADPTGRCGETRGRPIPARIPGKPLYARLAVAHARAGDRRTAIEVWRKATGASLVEAKKALDALLKRTAQV